MLNTVCSLSARNANDLTSQASYERYNTASSKTIKTIHNYNKQFFRNSSSGSGMGFLSEQLQ